MIDDIFWVKELELDQEQTKIFVSSLIQRISDSIIICDLETLKIILVNDKFLRLVHCKSFDEIVGMNLLDFVAEEDLTKSAEVYARIIERNYQEFRYIDKLSELRVIDNCGTDYMTDTYIYYVVYKGQRCLLFHVVYDDQLKKLQEEVKKHAGKTIRFMDTVYEEIRCITEKFHRTIAESVIPLIEYSQEHTKDPFARECLRYAIDFVKSAATFKNKVVIDFTVTEKRVAMYILSGINTSAIAEKLKVNPKTIYTHRRNITEKLKKQYKGDNLQKMLETHFFNLN